MGGTSVFIAGATGVSLTEGETDCCAGVGASMDVPLVVQLVRDTSIDKRMKNLILSFIISFVRMSLSV
jgi:hypothetical protein